MKKFITFVSILGCVLILAGAGVATVAFSMGGNPFRAIEDVGVRLYKYSEDMEHEFDQLGHHAEQVAIDMAHDILDDMHLNPNLAQTIAVQEESLSNRDFSEEETVIAAENGQETFECGYDEVTDLEIQIQGGDVTLVSDDEIGDLIVICDAGNPNNITFKNMNSYKKLELTVKKNEEYLVRVPSDWELSELEVECEGGTFEGENIRSKDAEFYVGGGKVEIHQIGGKDTAIECAGGSVEWTGEGESSRNLDVECAGGKVTLTLDHGVDASKVGYDMEYAAGKIELFGETYEGIGEQRRNASAGMPFLDMEVAGGTIVVK